MKAFLSYHFGDDVSEIVSLLQERHIEVVDALVDIEPGDSVSEAIKTSINKSDFVVIVYTKPHSNAIFEAGVAAGLNKPIFMVVAPNIDMQSYLLNNTYVLALPHESSKVLFSFELFLKNIRPKKSYIVAARQNVSYFNDVLHEFSNKYYKLKSKSEREYEAFFKEIFIKYNVSVVEQERQEERYIADFSIWRDSLSTVLGNPILIEVIKTLSKSSIFKLQDKIVDVLKRNPTSSFLVFYDVLEGINKAQLPNSQKCFYINITNFISNLENSGFDEAVIKIRSEIVHNKY